MMIVDSGDKNRPNRYNSSILGENGCHCGAHTQHRVFRYRWGNPSATYREIAKELDTTVNNVKVAVHNYKKRDPSRICPECFSDRLLDGVCHACGFEPASPLVPLEISFDEQSPVNHLQAGNELGSTLNYTAIGLSDNKGRFTNNGIVVKRWIDRALEDPLTRDVKSEVMEELKSYYPNEMVTDYAGKLCVKEVAEFRAKYPLLASSKNVRKQLSLNVMKRLEFLYPYLAKPHLQEVRGLE
jgi:hypothetical protein